METKIIETDVLIIGGGTAGCYAAIWLGENSTLSVALADKAAIKRSGCLAAGVNALNAYITKGHEPIDYVRYAADDADFIVREDLLLDISERLNQVTCDLERRGLTILKDENGDYVSRGWRNLKINGENIKPILAGEVKKQGNVRVFEHVNITDLRYDRQVKGAYGFGIRDGAFYEFRAKAVLVATGGAAGMYRANNPENLAHQMWYCPFNTGAGYCMGVLAGAEMTTFEMRFIALRCKDTIAPTGTIAQGAGAKQINSEGYIYEDRYGLSTSARLWGTVVENREGRGPCYLKTEGLEPSQEQELYKAYLNMAPLQTLKWIESKGPASENVEIEGSEPYVVGGHTASGYWVDRDRMTTLPGLFAAGDVAGGAPQKYVTGALAEGQIAAQSIVKYISGYVTDTSAEDELADQAAEKKREYEEYLANDPDMSSQSCGNIRELEAAMQKTMDEYAGGIRTQYRYTEKGLEKARERVKELLLLLKRQKARDKRELLAVYELRERLVICRVLIAHLLARKETRWHGFGENADHPVTDHVYDCYINSVLKDDRIQIIKRELIRIKGEK